MQDWKNALTKRVQMLKLEAELSARIEASSGNPDHIGFCIAATLKLIELRKKLRQPIAEDFDVQYFG